ncbi:MAG: hypothetical protein FD176_1508 [Rhodospirillaceae bacterium]|nr:MAG: hypothetical protein FD176_1508 [Rhodospirillaceae bacterium]TNC95998.1 MAG: hypothetical protein FD119_2089 [Stygiobacter sp.]
MSRPRFMPRPLQGGATQPFSTAEEAWLWYAQCQLARLAGCRPRPDMGEVARPCDPDDIHREVMRLFRLNRLKTEHLRTLAELGTRLAGESAAISWSDSQDKLWGEALDCLEISLRIKGIVA